METIGGRKFVLTVLLLATMFALAMVGKIATDMFVSFVEVVMGMYLSANVVAKFSEGGGKNGS